MLIKFLKYNNHLLEGLINGTLYFSNVQNLNDPFEGIFRYRVNSEYEAFKKFYLQDYGGNKSKLNYYFKNQEEFNKLINQSFDWRHLNNSVCCFSDETTITNTLMWASYTNNHLGVCLVFDIKQLKFLTIQRRSDVYVGNPNGPYEITYTDNYIDEDPSKRELNQHTFLTTKSGEWKHEKEFRYIGAQDGNHYFMKKSLKEIVFGLRATNETKYTIKNIVTSKYEKVVFKKVGFIKDKFKFEIVDELIENT